MPSAPLRIRRPAPVTATLRRLGERVRKARAEAGLSQAQLGAPHFTRAYVSAIELGKVRPAMKSLEFMADKLGKPVSYFVEDQETERRRLDREAAIARSSQLVSEGKTKEAVESVERLVRTATRPSERGQLLRSLGRALTQGHRGPEAVEVLNEAVRIFTSLGDTEQVTRARAQLGAALMEIPSYAEAQAELEAALASMSKLGVRDPLLKVHTLYNLGATFYMRGDFSAAVQQFERTQREGSDVADIRWQAGLYAGIGMSHLELGDLEAAVTYLRRSEALFDALHNRSRAIESRFHAAMALKAMGQRSKSGQLLATALAEAQSFGDEKLEAHIGSFLAVMHAEDGLVEEAVSQASAAVAIADRLGNNLLRLFARLNLAKVLRKTDPRRSERLLREVVAQGQGEGTTAVVSEAYTELSEVLASNGSAAEALKYSRKAYDLARRGKEV